MTILLIILFLLSCLSPISDPQKYWFIALMGFGFPVLLILLVIAWLFWLLFRKKTAWVCFFALLLGWTSISTSIALNRTRTFSEKKKEGAVRIASWNVARFIEWKRNNNKGSRQRLKILDQINHESPDILCLQEFFYSPEPTHYNNIDEIRHMGYPYFYFSYDPDGWRQFIGVVIFSKYPIIDSGLVRYFRPSMPEALIYADIKKGEDTFRVYNTHLQSVQFRKKDYEVVNNVGKVEDSFFVNTRTMLGKVKKALAYRSTQANVVKEILEDSPYPKIMCGDLNDIPNSYTYSKVRGDMKDVFLKKGFGLGRTFTSLPVPLRIDYIFTDNRFSPLQFKRVANKNSDHYMVMADLELKHP